MTTDSALIPLEMEHNRPFIQLEFRDSEGQWQKARTWVDTGGGAFLISKSLADRIGLKTQGEPFEAEGMRIVRPHQCPELRAGGMPVALDVERTFIVLDEPFASGIHRAVEVLLPGHVLKNYCTSFDYPGRQFGLGRTCSSSDNVNPSLDMVRTPVNPKSGFPRVEVEIAGERYGMLLDTGASYTMVSQALIDRWKEEHPDWPWIEGAVGPGNMADYDSHMTMMRLPQLRIGRHQLTQVGVVSRQKGIFEKWMSSLVPGPVVGALAGNVLKRFELVIDYPRERTLFKLAAEPDHGECEMVGLTLRQTKQGCVVAAVQPYLQGLIHPGDHIVAVDGLDASYQTLPVIVSALQGTQGTVRTIDVIRDGARLSVQAPIRNII